MTKRIINSLALLLVIAIFAVSQSLYPSQTLAETADEIRQKIDKRNSDIEALEKEIASYQKQIEALSSQSDTLSSTIKSLQLNRRKLESNIALTQDKISAKNFEIQRIDSEINGKKGNIDDNQRIIAKAFNAINELSGDSLPALVLGSRSISDTFNSFEEISIIQQGLYEKIDQLSKDKERLETNKKLSEKAKADLLKLNNQLSNERALVVSSVNEQAELLKETNESEASYKNLLAKKKLEAAAFQQEINNLESQLKIIIDPKLIPSIGSGVLSWPLNNILITQKYGRTDFSVKNKQYYSNGTHNGMDFRAPLNTPVKAAKSGTVTGVGNTDSVRGCKSYGRWVLVKHDNGLSTIYAHLSLPTVIVGQKVETGEMIAYSGSTGASTGPHLHFGVYANQGLRVVKLTRAEFPTVKNCIGSIIPVGKTLDPANYL